MKRCFIAFFCPNSFGTDNGGVIKEAIYNPWPKGGERKRRGLNASARFLFFCYPVFFRLFVPWLSGPFDTVAPPVDLATLGLLISFSHIVC